METDETVSLTLEGLAVLHTTSLRPLCVRLQTRLRLSPEAAEDAVQEAFARACEAITGQRQTTPITRAGAPAWLYRTALHAAIDTLRKRSTEPLEAAGEVQAATDIEREVEARLLLLGFLARLPWAMQQAELAYAAGYASAEIAPALGTTEQALRTQVHRMRQRLRERFAA